MEFPIFESKIPRTRQGDQPLRMREGAILCMEERTHTHPPSMDVRGHKWYFFSSLFVM